VGAAEHRDDPLYVPVAAFCYSALVFNVDCFRSP
jgi:hypothetical protein